MRNFNSKRLLPSSSHQIYLYSSSCRALLSPNCSSFIAQQLSRNDSTSPSSLSSWCRSLATFTRTYVSNCFYFLLVHTLFCDQFVENVFVFCSYFKILMNWFCNFHVGFVLINWVLMSSLYHWVLHCKEMLTLISKIIWFLGTKVAWKWFRLFDFSFTVTNSLVLLVCIASLRSFMNNFFEFLVYSKIQLINCSV